MIVDLKDARTGAIVKRLGFWRSFTVWPTVGEHAHDVFCGRHSGIPDCCIVYFINEWPFATAAERETALSEPGQYAAHYVRCPPCRQRPPVALRRCRCDRRLYLSTYTVRTLRA